MKCVICKNGDCHPGVTTVVLQRERMTMILREVPADICENCGEYYLDEPVARRVLDLARTAAEKGAELEIARFAA